MECYKCIWPFTKQWIGGGDYITVQKYVETVLSKDVHNFRDIAMKSGQLDVIDKYRTVQLNTQ